MVGDFWLYVLTPEHPHLSPVWVHDRSSYPLQFIYIGLGISAGGEAGGGCGGDEDDDDD